MQSFMQHSERTKFEIVPDTRLQKSLFFFNDLQHRVISLSNPAPGARSPVFASRVGEPGGH